MDADTRHQLKTNELGEMLLKVRLAFDKNWRQIAVVLGAAILFVIAVNVWRWNRAAAADAAWARLFEVQILDDADHTEAIQRLRDIASSAGDDAIRAIATYRAGCAMLHDADRDAAKRSQLLADAITTLKPVFDDVSAPPAIAAAAGFAMAQAYESQRDFANAKATYQAIHDGQRFDGTPFQNISAVRAGELDALAAVSVKFEPGKPAPPVPTTAPAAEFVVPAQPGERPTPAQPSTPPPAPEQNPAEPAEQPDKPSEQPQTASDAPATQPAPQETPQEPPPGNPTP